MGEAGKGGVSASHESSRRRYAVIGMPKFAFCDRGGQGSGFVSPTNVCQIDIVPVISSGEVGIVLVTDGRHRQEWLLPEGSACQLA
jgi:hypothetical protein